MLRTVFRVPLAALMTSSGTLSPHKRFPFTWLQTSVMINYILIKPRRSAAWLTHISHKLDAWLLETGASSPHAAIAMDGDRVDLPAGLDRPSS